MTYNDAFADDDDLDREIMHNLDLDDEYDYLPTPRGGQVNNRMGTLNRHQGIINRRRRKANT